ncbi:MAG: serine esterase [Chloroflexi bacterium]|nr:serine esterase [Chloroflexota bacterium]
MLETEFFPALVRDSRRLMVVLHGLGDSMDGYRWLPDLLALPWVNYLLVNAPDPYYGGYSWYDYDGDLGPGVRRSRALLVALLDEQRTRGFATEQTLLFGFSQGCLITIEVGLRYPHRFAGLIGISGHVFEPERLLEELSPLARQQRFLLTHGTGDPLIPIGPVRRQMALLQSAGLQIEWHEFAKDHTIAGEAELAVIRSFARRCCPDAESNSKN